MESKFVFLSALLVFFAGPAASAQTVSGSSSTGAAGGSRAKQRIAFRPATIAAGLANVNLTSNSHTGGVIWVDYDGDLWPDLFVSNGGGDQHFLFRNQGDGTFADVSSLIPKPDIMLEDAGAKYADVDNDGDEDIFVAVDNPAPVVPSQPVNPPDGGPNLFYRNQGDGTFVEEALAAGLVDPNGRRTISAAFADWDRDGFVDLFQGAWTMYGLPLGVHDDYDRLYRNDGTGSFLDVTATYALDGYGYDVLTSIWMDINNDRWPDLYVGHTAHTDAPPLFVTQDIFYTNNAGTSFTDEFAVPRGLGDDAYAPMGMDIADIDNDGDWDLYFTDTYNSPPRPLGNVLYRGDGAGGFEENSADVAGIQGADSWPCGFADFDLDGWSDLWVGTTSAAVPEFIYANQGDGTFATVVNAGVTGNTCKGGALADYDGDGDMDIAIWDLGPGVHLYRNESLRAGNYVQFKLYGTASNRGAIGAVIRVMANGMTQMRRVSGGDSAHSQGEAILHFGVGTATSVQVTVEWPSGADQVFPAVGVNDLVLIDEDGGILLPLVEDDGSTFDEASGQLQVRLKSNYRGRRTLTVKGLGTLRYDPVQRVHLGTFSLPAGADHKTITVDDGRGATWIFDGL